MELRVPGDKSVSQRALIFASLAEGTSRVRGILCGGDPASTADALRGLGVTIPELGPEISIQGMGLRGLKTPTGPLDLGNSGTGARLLLGVLAGQPLEAILTGDESLRSRPMARVTDPLSAMGGTFRAMESPGRLPIHVTGGPLKPFSYELPVASAQLKSSLLLAGLVGGVDVRLVEPGRSRDHTERVLGGMGVPVLSGPREGGWGVELIGAPAKLPPLDLQVPGDFSSAAFFVLLGLLQSGSEPLLLKGVGLNKTRTGMLPVLARMGGRFTIHEGPGPEEGEALGDILVEPSQLSGCEIGGSDIPALIDEVPILAIGASRAQGLTRITGAKELRVKETDRIRAMVQNLRAVGVEAEELDDGMEIEGSDGPLSGRVDSFGDHRIAMAFGILNALPGNNIHIEGQDVAGVSFPGFWSLLDSFSKRGGNS